jgi:hypothetical protein
VKQSSGMAALGAVAPGGARRRRQGRVYGHPGGGWGRARKGRGGHGGEVGSICDAGARAAARSGAEKGRRPEQVERRRGRASGRHGRCGERRRWARASSARGERDGERTRGEERRARARARRDAEWEDLIAFTKEGEGGGCKIARGGRSWPVGGLGFWPAG